MNYTMKSASYNELCLKALHTQNTHFARYSSVLS